MEGVGGDEGQENFAGSAGEVCLNVGAGFPGFADDGIIGAVGPVAAVGGAAIDMDEETAGGDGLEFEVAEGVRDCAEFLFGGLVTARMFEVFGDTGFVFAFRVLTAIISVSALIAVLYHLWIMRWIVLGLGLLFQKLIGVSKIESDGTTATGSPAGKACENGARRSLATRSSPR